MDRKLLTFFVGLVVTITLRAIPITALQNAALPVGGKPSQPNNSQPPQRGNSAPQSNKTESTSQTAVPPTAIEQIIGPVNTPEPPRQSEKSKFEQFLDKAETDPTVWVTMMIAFFAAWQVAIYRQMRDHSQETERAYVKMSHTAPGIRAGSITHGQRAIHVTLKVENNGNTPGKVTAVLSNLWIGNKPLPDEPPYSVLPPEPPRAFLVKNDYLFVPAIHDIPETHWTQIRDGIDKMQLWVIGYVDYIDRFKRRHRSGYARQYDRLLDNPVIPLAERNNLIFEAKRLYNYDRPRDEDEGNDWDEPAQ